MNDVPGIVGLCGGHFVPARPATAHRGDWAAKLPLQRKVSSACLSALRATADPRLGCRLS